MKRILLPLALAATAALLWQSATPAQACSYAEDYDPFDAADVVVAGRFVSWDVATDRPPVASFLPIIISFSVDQVLKGDAANVVEFVDGRSLNAPVPYSVGHRYTWGGGMCGMFGDEPPVGEAAIIGLSYGNDGTLRSGLGSWIQMGTWFYYDHGPGATGYDDAVSRLRGNDVPTLPLALAAVALPLAFVLAASFVFPARGSRM